MLFADAQVRVWLYTAPTDMRKSFDGLSGLVKHQLKEDPLSGQWFVSLRTLLELSRNNTEASVAKDQKIDVYLVCNARYHDTNFARLELLKLLGENADINTRVAENFSDTKAIADSALLITYTCDLRPTLEEQEALAGFLDKGGRWFALHATNALLDFVDGKADTPNVAPRFMELLGSRFIAHPANQRIEVKVTEVEHPLTDNIADFDVEDEEPYYCEAQGEQIVLLEASYNKPSVGYVRSEFGTDQESHPQMYLHPWGAVSVLYLSLGHCTGKHDMKPMADIVPVVRGSWNSPVYYELLRRGILWGIGEL